MFRIGHGFDAHRFKKGRKLILGGVPIPYSLGLEGHSDADVLLHAVMNALLGAMGKGDIGTHFPDTDPQYKNISSEKLLLAVLDKMRRSRFRIVNVDVTLLAQKPKLSPYFAAIKKKLSGLLKIQDEALNIKAATTEKMGWIGRGLGMAAIAVTLLRKRKAL